MSIIYDALNKLEKNKKETTATPENKKPGNPNLKRYIKYLGICILGLIAAKAVLVFIPMLQNHSPKGVHVSGRGSAVGTSASLEPKIVKIEKKETVSVKPASSESMQSSAGKEKATLASPISSEPETSSADLVLNGIVFAPDTSYALINNRIVTVGDEIEGAAVVQITQDFVEVKRGEILIKLTPSNKKH